LLDVISEIQAASQEQSSGIEQINKAATQMDAITQEDAHMAQELISMAETLRDQSSQMLGAISAFSPQAVAASRGSTIGADASAGGAVRAHCRRGLRQFAMVHGLLRFERVGTRSRSFTSSCLMVPGELGSWYRRGSIERARALLHRLIVAV
jgi:hypothetical protein